MSESPRRVLQVAYAAACEAMPARRHRFGPRKFAQHRLVACPVLKEFPPLDYRGLAAHLAEHRPRPRPSPDPLARRPPGVARPSGAVLADFRRRGDDVHAEFFAGSMTEPVAAATPKAGLAVAGA